MILEVSDDVEGVDECYWLGGVVVVEVCFECCIWKFLMIFLECGGLLGLVVV